MTELAVGAFPLPVNTELIHPQEAISYSHSGSRPLFREVAGHFGVQLEEQEFTDWSALGGAAHLADHILDVQKADLVPALLGIINGNLIDGLDYDTQLRFRNYMLARTPEQYEEVMRQIALVPPPD